MMTGLNCYHVLLYTSLFVRLVRRSLQATFCRSGSHRSLWFLLWSPLYLVTWGNLLTLVWLVHYDNRNMSRLSHGANWIFDIYTTWSPINRNPSPFTTYEATVKVEMFRSGHPQDICVIYVVDFHLIYALFTCIYRSGSHSVWTSSHVQVSCFYGVRLSHKISVSCRVRLFYKSFLWNLWRLMSFHLQLAEKECPFYVFGGEMGHYQTSSY